MTIEKRRHGDTPIGEHLRLPILPGNPDYRESQPLLSEVEGIDPVMDRGNHLLRESDLERLRSFQEHRPLKQGGQTSDVIDMAVSDQDSIEVPNQGSTIAQRMDARLASIDEQMPPLQEQKGTGKESVGLRKAGTCTEKADGWHECRRLPDKNEKRA
jgi:hypothetical protein